MDMIKNGVIKFDLKNNIRNTISAISSLGQFMHIIA